MKIALKRPKDTRNVAAVWKSCLPFVNNGRGVLIHRPKTVVTYDLHKEPHMAVHYWCNNAVSGNKNLSFLAVAPNDKPVCKRCEDAAVAAGLTSTDELCGAHRHKGVVVAAQTCCKEATNVS